MGWATNGSEGRRGVEDGKTYKIEILAVGMKKEDGLDDFNKH